MYRLSILRKNLIIWEKAVLGKRRLKETGLYELGRGQGRVKMIRVVEAGIEIDGNVRGRLLPLVASLGNGCTFLRIKIILHKTTCFFSRTNFALRRQVCMFETAFPCTENIPMTDVSNFHAGIEAANIGGGWMDVTERTSKKREEATGELRTKRSQ